MIDLNIVRQLIEMAAISPEFRPFAEALTACEAEIVELQGSSDVLLDDFAMHAMGAMIAAIGTSGDPLPNKIAELAYAQARAMMAERGKTATPIAIVGSQEPVSVAEPTADSVTRELFGGKKKG